MAELRVKPRPRATVLRIPTTAEYDRMSWYARREAAAACHTQLLRRRARERRQAEQAIVAQLALAHAAVIFAGLPPEPADLIARRRAVLETMSHAPKGTDLA